MFSQRIAEETGKARVAGEKTGFGWIGERCFMFLILILFCAGPSGMERMKMEMRWMMLGESERFRRVRLHGRLAGLGF